MLISKAAFLGYQTQFYNKLRNTPYRVNLLYTSIVGGTSEDFTAEFVGDSQREVTSYSFQTLYEKEISNRMREKYGLPMEVNGIIYLSPRQLTPVFGDYHLDWNRTKVQFEGRTQVIDKVVYLEELYGSCVGVQIFLKDSLKGG